MPETSSESIAAGILLAAGAVVANQAATRWFFAQQEKKTAQQAQVAQLEAQLGAAQHGVNQLVAEIQRLRQIEQRFTTLTTKPRASSDRPLNILDFPSEQGPETEA